MRLFYDRRDEPVADRRGDRRLYWLDDLGAAPLTEARPDDEGFVFAGARSSVDTFAYNGDDGYVRRHAVGDVRLRARATIEGEGELRVALVHDDRIIVGSLRAGRVAIQADGATTAEADVALPAGQPWDLTFTYVDRRASLHEGERTLLVWDDPRPPVELSVSSVRLQVLASSPAILADLRLDRDLHFGSTFAGRHDPAATPQTVPVGSYFLIGDNVSHSHDSRHIGFVSEARLRGRVLGSY